MCAGQMNPASRLIGESNFSKLDPLMGSIQRFDSNHVAPKVAGYFGQVPRGYVPADNKNKAPSKVAKPPAAERWGAGAAGARGASGSLLTGQNTPPPKTTLLGG